MKFERFTSIRLIEEDVYFGRIVKEHDGKIYFSTADTSRTFSQEEVETILEQMNELRDEK